MSTGGPTGPTTPTAGGLTCQQIRDELSKLKNDVVLIESQYDVATLKLKVAKDAYDKAVADEQKARMALMGVMNRQLTLHGLANQIDCDVADL